MSNKLILLLFSLCVMVNDAKDAFGAVSTFNNKHDFIPRDSHESQYPTKFRSMTKQNMLDHRERSQSYKQFLNGKFVATVHTLLRPLV